MAAYTDEDENFLRIFKLVTSVGTNAIRVQFDILFPPANLQSELSYKKSQLRRLKTSNILNAKQWDVLFPSSGGTVSSSDFDITLMICLIRNIAAINQPVNGFNNLPPPSEKTPAANIARIKYFRNKLAHSDNDKINQCDFNTFWTELSEAVVRLGGSCLQKRCDAIKDLKITSSGEIDTLKEQITCLKDELKEDIEKLRDDVEQLKTDKMRVSDLMAVKLHQWKKDEEYYVETTASRHVMNCLQDTKCLSVVGPPGSGKTFLVQHVALQMDKIGFNVISVNSPNEIRENFKFGTKTLFVVDDMCGNFTANTARLDIWKNAKKDLTLMLNKDVCKLILTCRSQVFKDEGFKHSDFLLFRTCICNLVDDKLALTNSEKDNLANKYFKTRKNEVECLYKYDFFPLLCKLYDNNKDNPSFCLNRFLKEPFDIYTTELDDLYRDCKEGKYKFSALLLLVICNNQLEKKVLEGKKLVKTILEECGINERLSVESLISIFNTLTGSFLVNENGVYRTIHDKLFDYLVHYFGTKKEKEFIDLLIKHADKNVIRERFLIIESGTCDFKKRQEYVINIQDDNLHIIQLYTQRVFDDMKVDSIDTYIWSNDNIRTKIFIKTVFSIIEKLHNDDILELIKVSSSLFLLYMFVMDVKDIESYYNGLRFGIIVDNVNLEIFTERILHDMTETKNVSDYSHSKCCRNPKFRTELLSCMKKLSTDKIQELIKSASPSFVQLMFVMKEEDIKQRIFSSSSFYKLYGIVIPKDIIQMYMQRVFNDMSSHTDVPTYISKLRCSSNEDFNTALQRFMNDNLSVRNEDLKTASISFIQVMCILTPEDIKHNSPHVYKRYGFNIPCNARKEYIERVFDDMTRSDDVNKHVKGNRNRTNTIFKTGLLEFIEKLGRSKIQNLIKTVSYDFLNRLCVLTIDDIKDGDNWDRYGVVIPEEYIQLYIDRWFNGMIKLENCENYVAKNRNTHREKFKISLRSYLKELQEYRIEELIQTASSDFLNKWFVTKNEDIQIQSKKEYEQYGIILQGKHLQMYNERIWMLIKMDKDFMHAMGCNRNTRYVLEYVNQLHISQITDLMKTTSEFCVESFHKIKVDVNNDLEEESSYCQSLDNVVRSILSMKAGFIKWPISRIDQYMYRMVSDWRKGYLCAVIRNVNMKNKSFMERFVGYLNHLEPSIISELVNGVRQKCADCPCLNFRFYHNNSINAIMICSRHCEVNLAKWCVENHCNGNRYDKHYKLCALFILIVFDNQIKEKALIDEDQTVKDMIMLFGRNHDIHHAHGDIPARLVRDALDSSLNGIVIKENGVYHVINTAVVKYLFIYFGSIEHLSTILIEYADLNSLYKIFMLDKQECGRKYLIDLPATNIHRCIERIFESLSRSKQNIKYILGQKYLLKYNCLRNIKAITTYNGNLKKEAIELLIKDSCIEFLNTFCLVDGTEDDEYPKSYPFILIPGDLITMYIRRLFDNMKISECVEVCLRKNRNKNNRAFHTELSTFFKIIQRDDVEELIAKASSDFISHMLVISEDDIKYENCWEYERYGIVIPEDLINIYIDRVFFDVTNSNKVLQNRNVQNKKFWNEFQSCAISISEDKVLWLIKTASSTFLSHMFLSTEGDVYDLRSQIRECSFNLLSRQFYKTFQQHLSKEKSKMFYFGHKSITEIYRFSHNLFTFTSQYSYEKDNLNVFLTGSFKDDKTFDNLHQHPITQVFTNKTIKLCVRSSAIIVKENIKRMIQDWNDGKVHDVFANINLSNPSFQSEFITYLKNTDGAVQTNLAKTNDIVTGDSPLAVCCYAGIKELAEWCLENNTNTNSINKFGEPPLYIACYHIHPDIVWCLLNHENKADANMKTEVTNITPLYLACEKNLKTIALHLLKEEIDVNHTFKDKTPLFVACKYGHIDIVRLLLTQKEDKIDINKGKPLYTACKKGHTEIVSLLLNHTADEVDVNKKTSFKGETPLYVACEGGYNDIVSLLLKHESSGLNKSRFDGATSLFVASQKGYDEVVATLCLQKEIKIDKCMIFGMSPLFIASLLGHTKIVEMLLNRNADSNKCVHDKETVEILLNGEKQRSWRQQDLETYINDLREKDSSFDLKLVKFKKEGKGEDRVSNLFFGSSPLHIGCVLGHTEIVKLLVDRISDVNNLNEIGNTPLCLAKDLGHEDIVSILLSKGAKHTLERRARKRKWTPENN
ncbi:uncharacterized protein [Mytilus edulis]|uniref:uncharacterized protein n=1 Tax=Mytilus edulis TaxID=6550 RepID=UPI0039EE5188